MGFEPTSDGFANHCLRPLGYAAVKTFPKPVENHLFSVLESGIIIIKAVVASGKLNIAGRVPKSIFNSGLWRGVICVYKQKRLLAFLFCDPINIVFARLSVSLSFA